MSVELPNSLNAAGVFDNINSPLFEQSPILSSAGIEPFDAAQSPSNIVGGITRISAGVYIVRQVDAIDPLEGVAVAMAAAPNLITANILPGAPTIPTEGEADAKAVGINASVGATGVAADTAFTLMVWRFATGPKWKDLVSL